MATATALPAPVVNPRSSWAVGRPPLGPLPTEEVRFLIVHHSGSHNGHSAEDVPGILAGFYDFHTGPSREWDDIAYNFLIDADGGIWEGRAGSIDGPVAGDAAGGNQGFTQLVCLIGNFDEAKPTDSALASLVQLTAWLADRYDVPTAPGSEVSFVSRGSNRHPAGAEVRTPTLTGHRTMSQTSCPGDRLDEYVVAGLMADVSEARVAARASTTTTTSTSTTIAEPATSTTMADTTSTVPPVEVPPTTLPHAVGPENGLRAAPLAAAGAVLVTVGGLLVWRHRRMGG